MEFLVNELIGKRPLLPPDLPMTPEVGFSPGTLQFTFCCCCWGGGGMVALNAGGGHGCLEGSQTCPHAPRCGQGVPS